MKPWDPEQLFAPPARLRVPYEPVTRQEAQVIIELPTVARYDTLEFIWMAGQGGLPQAYVWPMLVRTPYQGNMVSDGRLYSYSPRDDH